MQDVLFAFVATSPSLGLALVLLLFRSMSPGPAARAVAGLDELPILVWAGCWMVFGTTQFFLKCAYACEPELVLAVVYEWLLGLLPLSLVLLVTAAGRSYQRRRDEGIVSGTWHFHGSTCLVVLTLFLDVTFNAISLVLGH